MSTRVSTHVWCHETWVRILSRKRIKVSRRTINRESNTNSTIQSNHKRKTAEPRMTVSCSNSRENGIITVLCYNILASGSKGSEALKDSYLSAAAGKAGGGQGTSWWCFSASTGQRCAFYAPPRPWTRGRSPSTCVWRSTSRHGDRWRNTCFFNKIFGYSDKRKDECLISFFNCRIDINIKNAYTHMHS